MSVRVEGESLFKDLPEAEKRLLLDLTQVVNRALEGGVDHNHVLSLLAAVMCKTGLAVGVAPERLGGALAEGVKITAEHEVGKLAERRAAAS